MHAHSYLYTQDEKQSEEQTAAVVGGPQDLTPGNTTVVSQ
jgi:hypothetical protein